MTSNSSTSEPSFEALTSESARQRWEWVHQAIALAKKSNSEAMQEAEAGRQPAPTDSAVSGRTDPQLSIAR